MQLENLTNGSVTLPLKGRNDDGSRKVESLRGREIRNVANVDTDDVTFQAYLNMGVVQEVKASVPRVRAADKSA